MPDLPALQAQVANDPSIGRKAPVKMISPKASNLEASGIPPTPSLGSPNAAICSFSIPLIAIVASFVFKLFLPIVVLAFQQWWMLALKFCIPPSFSLSAGVAAKLSANANADVDASFAAGVKADIGVNLGASAASGIDSQFSAGTQAAFAANLSTDFSADLPPDVPVDPPPPNSVVTANLPSITANLQYLPEAPLS
jgi:hypothetical protein